jgi:hypothetical protein
MEHAFNRTDGLAVGTHVPLNSKTHGPTGRVVNESKPLFNPEWDVEPPTDWHVDGKWACIKRCSAPRSHGAAGTPTWREEYMAQIESQNYQAQGGGAKIRHDPSLPSVPPQAECSKGDVIVLNGGSFKHTGPTTIRKGDMFIWDLPSETTG